MPIIRVTKKQIEEANKAREAALKVDDDFRRYEEQRQRLLSELHKSMEEGILDTSDDEFRKFLAEKKQPKKEVKAAAGPKEEQPS